jgi:hypothetical protein
MSGKWVLMSLLREHDFRWVVENYGHFIDLPALMLDVKFFFDAGRSHAQGEPMPPDAVDLVPYIRQEMVDYAFNQGASANEAGIIASTVASLLLTAYILGNDPTGRAA